MTFSVSNWDCSDIITPLPERTWYDSDPRHDAWKANLTKQLRYIPLLLIVHRIEKKSRDLRKFPDNALSNKAELIDEMLASWRHCRNPECLPRSLYRYKWLRNHGLSPQLVLGLHVPTDRMHAWVELDGQVLGEEPEEMLCYQGAVRFIPHQNLK